MAALDDLEELRTFALVVEAGSLSAAARLMRVTVNAVSRRIMRLERNLGAKVLHRSTRAIAVTDEGRALYARTRTALDEIDAAADEVRNAKHMLRGSIRMAMPGGAATQGVLRGLGALLNANPELHLQVRLINRNTDPILGAVDVVLHVGSPPASSLVARRLLTSSWKLAAAPAYFVDREIPKRPRDLLNHRCMRYLSDRPQDEWRLVDSKGRTEAVPVEGNFESDDSRVLGDAVYAGLGIGVRPATELDAAVERGLLVPVLPEYHFESLDIYALMPKGAARLPRIAKFLDALREALGQVV